MSTFLVNSDNSLSKLFGELREAYTQYKFLRGSFKTGVDRSRPQNAITHVWYSQIAQELRDDDELGWKCYCKLHHGVPIMRLDLEFRECYDNSIKHLQYEQKLIAMRQFPVTSLMSKEQLSKYAEAVQADFLTRGVVLEFPVAKPDRVPA